MKNLKEIIEEAREKYQGKYIDAENIITGHVLVPDDIDRLMVDLLTQAFHAGKAEGRYGAIDYVRKELESGEGSKTLKEVFEAARKGTNETESV